MKIIETVHQFEYQCVQSPRPMGLVPTMGNLHKGHMSLIKHAQKDNASVAVSIFVNPNQFGSTEDFSTYPRNIKSDLDILKDANVDIVFIPSIQEMYPKGFAASIDVGLIATRLEGEFRPSHFNGVATVLCKLISMSRPNNIYLGQKDAQQCLVIKKLNDDLNLGTQVVILPTIRDDDGLAISSRNIHLSESQRKAAVILHESLHVAKNLWHDETKNIEHIKLQMCKVIHTQPLANIDYISIANVETLEELKHKLTPAIALGAIRIGHTRLIDNIIL